MVNQNWKQEYLRSLPAIGTLLNHPRVKTFPPYLQPVVTRVCQEIVDQVRSHIMALDTPEKATGMKIDIDYLASRVVAEVDRRMSPHLTKVINATGVVLHTNLGRATLAEAAARAAADAARFYTNLEFNLALGTRGSRYEHLEELLCRLTGAEAGMVVNNNAAAVLLVLNTLANGKEVVVSRGQLVEIGGGFRIPEVMEKSGARLREVGTTNKTYLKDYEQGINEQTGLLLKVHTSNYRIMGFTADVAAGDLVKLGQKYGLPVFEDLGSGVLVDLARYHLTPEPTVQDSLAAGVDLVAFSGDKLLGGPQAGLIVGRKQLIDQIKRNQLTRALRVDKMTIAALEATLRLYLNESEAVQNVPALRMLTTDLTDLADRAQQLASGLMNLAGTKADIRVVEVFSQVGGGALPLTKIPSYGVAVVPRDCSPAGFEERLRTGCPPVIARIQREQVLFDMRTVFPEELPQLLQVLLEAL